MRFEEATEDVYNLLHKIIDEHFVELRTAVFLVMFDLKKRVSKGKYVIARIKKTNDELKAFTMDDNGVPADYIMFIDKNIYTNIDERDKERIIFHELCHCDVGEETFNIKDHEIQGFYAEIDFNSDDTRWSERLLTIADHLYSAD